VGLQPRPAHVGQGPLGLGLGTAYMYPGGSPSINQYTESHSSTGLCDKMQDCTLKKVGNKIYNCFRTDILVMLHPFSMFQAL
jgi:hypothetical protein